MRGVLAVAAAFVGLLVSSSLGAQATRATPGAVIDGKVVVRVYVVLRDEVTPYHPVSGLELRFYRNANDSTIAVTDAAGTVTALLPEGEYRLVSARAAVWKGLRYSWSIPLIVRPGMPAIDLREPQSSTGSAAMVVSEEGTSATVLPAPGARPMGTAASVAERQGFWIGLGLGAGSAGCEGCDDRLMGVSGNLALGGTLNRHVLLGVFFNGWTKSEDGSTLTGGTLTGGLRVYPSARHGFFLTGGAGVGTIELDTETFGDTSDMGAGAMLGLGYDIRVGRGISVTPFLSGVGISIDGNTANFVQAGLGVIWH
jgi:hypothetical protein